MADHDPRRLMPAQCPGDSVADIWARDNPPVPEIYKADSFTDLGPSHVQASRYTSADFFEAERTKMWPRVWQMAARDEEFPDPGDLVVYDNLGKSVILVRQPDRSVKAFWNV